MSELIGGKEALIAMANGEDVEYMDTSNTFKSLGWGNAFGLETNLFFSDRFKFRLKPRTITLNDVELPKPLSAVFNTNHKTSVELDFETEQDAINFAKMFSNNFIEFV